MEASGLESLGTMHSEIGGPHEHWQFNASEDVLGRVPHYAVPNTSSLLPTYTNEGQDTIHRSFHTGSYDFLKHLPDDIRYRQVEAVKAARREAARQFLSPANRTTVGTPASKQVNTQGLFQVFDYQPSPYNQEHLLDVKAKLESQTKRLALAGKEFTPAGPVSVPKHQDLTQPGVNYPYLGGPYGELEEAIKAYKKEQAAKLPTVPFKPPGSDKPSAEPTRETAWDMMAQLRTLILKDWEGSDVSIFENHQDCWVIRIAVSTIDSVTGLEAYMNVFARCNPLVNQYKLVKVTEFWHTLPGDGGAYYVLRPPWVHVSCLDAFYALYPEEQQWATSQAAQELAAKQPAGEASAPQKPKPTLLSSRDGGRLNWGVNSHNFITNTPAPAAQAKYHA